MRRRDIDQEVAGRQVIGCQTFEDQVRTIGLSSAVRIHLHYGIAKTIILQAQEAGPERVRGPVPTGQPLRQEVVEEDHVLGNVEIRQRGLVELVDVRVGGNHKGIRSAAQRHRRGNRCGRIITAVMGQIDVVVSGTGIDNITGVATDAVDGVVTVPTDQRFARTCGG